VVRSGHPRGSRAGGGARPCPRFITLLAGTWNSPEAPGARASLRVISVDKSAHAVLAPCDPDNDLVLNGERSNRNRVSGLVLGDRGVPANLSGLRIERHQVRIHGSHEEKIPE